MPDCAEHITRETFNDEISAKPEVDSRGACVLVVSHGRQHSRSTVTGRDGDVHNFGWDRGAIFKKLIIVIEQFLISMLDRNSQK